MALKIIDYSNYIAPDADYPYGDIKNNPGDATGTQINRMTASDIWQFFQRMCAFAGITPSGSPDNVTNGFQFPEALNTLIQERSGVFAEAVGAGGNNPVILSGCVVSVGLSTSVTDGWFFYAGKLVKMVASSTSGGCIGPAVAMITIVSTDGYYSASIACGTNVTDSTHFPASVLGAEVFRGFPWEDCTGFIGSFASTTAKYSKDTTGGRVSLRGNITGTGTNDMFTLPAGFAPSVDMYFLCHGLNTGLANTVYHVYVTSAGVVGTTTALSGGSSTLYLDSISFPTL